METRTGDCPLQYNYQQERFIMACYSYEKENRPAYGFWQIPNWLKQGIGILGRAEVDARDAAAQQ